MLTGSKDVRRHFGYKRYRKRIWSSTRVAIEGKPTTVCSPFPRVVYPVSWDGLPCRVWRLEPAHVNVGRDDFERLDCPFILIILKAAVTESKQVNCSLSMQSPCILGGFLIIIKCLIKWIYVNGHVLLHMVKWYLNKEHSKVTFGIILTCSFALESIQQFRNYRLFIHVSNLARSVL